VRRAIPDIDRQIAAGDFRPLHGWLGEHVHAKASLRSTAELIESATGAPLGTADFRRHLRARYLGNA